jgi:hypothetical protein
MPGFDKDELGSPYRQVADCTAGRSRCISLFHDGAKPSFHNLAIADNLNRR